MQLRNIESSGIKRAEVSDLADSNARESLTSELGKVGERNE